jgi:hypothetical protein
MDFFRGVASGMPAAIQKFLASKGNVLSIRKSGIINPVLESFQHVLKLLVFNVYELINSI